MAHEIDDRAVMDAFNRLLALGENPRQPLLDVGRVLLTRIQMGFHTGTDPYGRKWKPLTSRQGQPLRDRGHLMASFNYRVDGNTLTVGTADRRAPVHQFGAVIKPKTKPALRFMVNGQWVSVKKVTIPARPQVPLEGLPPLWREDIVATFNEHMARAGKG